MIRSAGWLKLLRNCLTGVAVASISLFLILPASHVLADSQTSSGSIDLGGLVPGAPPSQAPVILYPVNNQHFKQAHISVYGTCQVTTTVEIYKNSILTGSTLCNASGRFGLEIDLVIGSNRLVARSHDSLNQYGPDSNVVTVYYDALPSSLPQLVLLADALYQGQSGIRPLRIDLEINGGQTPYALSIDWGDSSNPDLISRNNGDKFTISHLYKNPGSYKIVIKASDSLGNSAYLEVIGVVSGPIYKYFNNAAPTNEQFEYIVNILLVALAIILLLIIVFWSGERWEYHELKEDHKIIGS